MARKSIKDFLELVRKKIDFQRLEKREKVFLTVGVVFLICFCVIQFIIFPYLDAKKRLDKSLAVKKADLARIIQMQKEYVHLEKQAGVTQNRLSERAPGFTLFSFLEEQATKANVKQQIQYMKPSTSNKDEGEQQSIVEMKLQHITLAQLVGFLRLAESSKNMVFVKHISIQGSNSEGNGLDVILQVFTFTNMPAL